MSGSIQLWGGRLSTVRTCIAAGSVTGEARNRRSSAVSLPEGWDAAAAAHGPRPRASSMSPTVHDMAPSNVRSGTHGRTCRTSAVAARSAAVSAMRTYAELGHARATV